MWSTTLEELTCNDAVQLVTDEVQEDVSLDFKQELPQGGDEDRREFLYDVAAMANTAGGFLVYGIADRRDIQGRTTGVAEKVVGLSLENIDSEMMRLEHIIRDGIAPRLSGTVSKVLPGPQGSVLVISIPKSWNGPHMVTFKQVNKFYGRVASGKYLMSIDQIRTAFSQGAEFTGSIRAWRDRRKELIQQNKGPCELRSGPAMILHIVPASAFAQSAISSSWRLTQKRRLEMYCPSVNAITNGRYNGDGYLKFVDTALAPTTGYTQVFRSGIIEYVTAGFSWDREGLPGESADVFTDMLEQELIDGYKDAVRTYAELHVTAPLYATVAVSGLSGRRMSVSSHRFRPFSIHGLPVMRDDQVALPEILLDREDPYAALKVLADFLWQAGGLEKTPSVDKEGGWNPFLQR